MNKTQTLLQALAETPSLTSDELAEKLDWNKSKTKGMLSWLKGQKRIIGIKGEGGGNALRYSIAGDAAPKTGKRGAKKPAKRAKRAKKKTQTSAPRSLKDVARKHLRKAHANGDRVSLAQRHISTTLTTLEALIDISGCEPSVVSAFKSHKEAIELALGTA